MLALLILLVLVLACPCNTFMVVHNKRSIFKAATANDNDKSDVIKQNEVAVVTQGLTHIKYNKYAPTPEEASKMTPEEFQATIYKRMKEAERKRREEQKGLIGGAIADDYLNSLSK